MRRIGVLDTLAGDDPEASVRAMVRLCRGLAGVGLGHWTERTHRIRAGQRAIPGASDKPPDSWRAGPDVIFTSGVVGFGTVASSNPHGADRVRERRRSGGRRFRRKLGAARRQRHRIRAV